jgi:hypothetical protein
MFISFLKLQQHYLKRYELVNKNPNFRKTPFFLFLHQPWRSFSASKQPDPNPNLSATSSPLPAATVAAMATIHPSPTL